MSDNISMSKAKLPIHIVLLTTELYPDVKRGGAVFSKNFYEVCETLVFKINVITLYRDLKICNPNILTRRLVWAKSDLGNLIAMPFYIIFGFQALSRLRSHFVFSNGPYESIIPIIARTPFAYIIHDDSSFTSGIITRFLSFFSLNKAQFIICPSIYSARIVFNYLKKPDKRIFIVNNFVNMEKLRKKLSTRIFNISYPELNNFRKVLFIGKNSPHKGVPALIKAISKVKMRIPDVVLIVAGPGSEHKKQDLKQGVIYAGILNDEELASYLAAADIFAIPSIGQEGFGIALLEAMVAEKPIIAGDIPAFREVAGDAAIFVDGKDSKSICSALIRILTDGKLANKLSSKARERSKLFSWERIRNQCLEMLTFLMNKV